MDTGAHLEHLRRETLAFAETVASAPGDTPVTTCPGWSLADLVRHVGGIQRWAAELVAQRVRVETWRRSLPIEYPADTDDLGAWLAGGIDEVVAKLASTDPTERVWTWGADPHARFWPRRMLFETVVHHADALAGLGRIPPVTPEVAVDGIDELFEQVPFFARFGDVRPRPTTGTVALAATDVDESWRVPPSPRQFFWDRGAGGDAVVSAPAADLLLLVYRRPVAAPVVVEGDRDLLDAWLASLAF